MPTVRGLGSPLAAAVPRVSRARVARVDAAGVPVKGRGSYRGLMALPAWGLYDAADGLVATCRAKDAYVARDLFKRHGLEGARVRRV